MTSRNLAIAAGPGPSRTQPGDETVNVPISTSTVVAILDRAAETFATLAAELREFVGSTGNRLDGLGDREAHGDRALADDTAKPNAVNDTLMTAKEVGEMLHLDVRTVRRHARLGLLPSGIKIGKALRWKRKTIERWLKEQEP